MKFTQAVKSYLNEVDGGWVVIGQIFNVGQEHKPGLRTITESRAKQCMQARLHIEYVEGDPQLKPTPNDPIAARVNALSAAHRRIPAVDQRRIKKVDPPAQNKAPARRGQQPDPPPPPRAADAERTNSETAPQAPNSSTPGGPTGVGPSSQSSSAPGPASKASTGNKRGMRRGDADHQKRARVGSRSTKPGESSETETPSTAPTSPGGGTGKAARSSKA